MKHSKKGSTAAANLTDDLIIQILSRLPVKSVCRFKCVSRHWYCLISHSEYCKKLPQTISGFFYTEYCLDDLDYIKSLPNFEGISGDHEHLLSDPSLPFLTGYRTITPKSCCNGLVLCFCWKESPRDESDFVVCNPATEEWVVLPDSGSKTSSGAYHLGFEPDISPQFHVFQILEGNEEDGYNVGVNIYSSETGLWYHKENGWDDDEFVTVDTRSVFFNGTLHLHTYDFKILAVDTEAKTWRTVYLPENMCFTNFWLGGPMAFFGHSQGRLYYINVRRSNTSKLSVWILDDSNGNEWILKYSIRTSQLFEDLFRTKDIMFQRDYALIAIHPECSLILFVWRPEDILLSYDMDRGKICVIRRLKDHLCDIPVPLYLSYVPTYSQINRPRVQA